MAPDGITESPFDPLSRPSKNNQQSDEYHGAKKIKIVRYKRENIFEFSVKINLPFFHSACRGFSSTSHPRKRVIFLMIPFHRPCNALPKRHPILISRLVVRKKIPDICPCLLRAARTCYQSFRRDAPRRGGWPLTD